MPKQVRTQKTYKGSLRKNFTILGLLLRAVGLTALFVFLFGSILFLYYTKDLPRPEKFAEKKLIESTKIYDRTGKTVLYEMYNEEKRTAVAFDDIPEHLKEAVISTEDSNFYRHFGLDVSAIIRSLLTDVRLGTPKYGGSTISQQLVRSSYLSNEKTIARKVKEIILTLQLELRYSKTEILGFYLNEVPFGNNAYGVEAASQTYFGKSVKNISLTEAAALTALIKKPSYLGNIDEHKDELLVRRDYVLDRMRQEGYISEEEKKEAKEKDLVFQDLAHSIRAPHFTLYVKDYLIKKYGEEFLQENGLKVYTSLDWDLQQIAEKTVKNGVLQNKAFNAHNAALVAINPKSGEILSMVGSKDYFADSEGCTPNKGCLFDPKVNVATYYIGRQPGSAFKPFVYATAFKKGYTDQTIVVDEPTNFGLYGGVPYEPQNYDGLFRGPITLRSALAQSLNVPAVKVLADFAGLEDSIKTAKELGITTLNKPSSYYGLSLVLGGGEVKLLDMASAYSVFASGGLKFPPISVLRIEDQNGNIIEENKKLPVRILQQEVADLITNILADNNARAPVFGLHSNLYIPGYVVAVKSGTTQDFKDGWVIGYTPSIVVGVWVGNNNGAQMAKDPAVITAGPIWQRFFEQALLLKSG